MKFPSHKCLNDILWPDHIQWQPPTDQTLYRTRPFTEFWVVSIEHLQRCGMPTEDAYSLRTPGPIPFGICTCSSNRNHTTYLWRLPNTTYLPVFTLPNKRGFNRIYATGVACQQGTLTPPDTWSRPLWDLHMFYLLRPTLFRTCRYFTGLCSSNIPRYFLNFAPSI